MATRASGDFVGKAVDIEPICGILTAFINTGGLP